MTTTGIILAAGKGTRMRSKTPKALHKVAGVALVGHCVRIMRIAGIDNIVVVVSQDVADRRELEDALLPRTQVVIQAEQLGTANALRSAQAATEGYDTLVVSPVDMILVTDEDVQRMIQKHEESSALATILGAKVEDPTGLGRIRVGSNGQPFAVLEQHEADDDLLLSNLINTSWYTLDNSWIWDELDSVEPATTGEFYLPRIIESAAALQRSNISVARDPSNGLGINDRVQLANVERITRARTNEAHMMSGVTLQDPDQTYIDVDVEIGLDTEIGAGSQIGTGTSIGSGVTIGPNTLIVGSSIGDGAVVDGARVVDSTVGDHVKIGTNALIRGHTELKPGAVIGNLAEIKKSVIGSGTHVSHFSYVGDATVGENVNIGAGTITCNYDGKDKHRTTIEDGALIGSSTMLIAPVTVGREARTGAGSVVRHDVAPGDTVAGVPARSIKSK